MADYFFFLSYARLDRKDDPDDVIGKFYEELKREVRALTNADPDHVGFFDAKDIEPGDTWPHDIGEGLRTCRVFVPIFSPTYFDRSYCGKEWGIFRGRLQAYAQHAAVLPPLIQPVLLVPRTFLKNLPAQCSDIQDEYEKYPSAYREYGLKQLVRLQKHQDEFRDFVYQLAQRIVEVVNQHPMPSTENIVDIKLASNAFESAAGPGGAPAPPPAPTEAGPKYAQFLFIAGRKDQLVHIRHSRDAYGTLGGMDWKPYYPDLDDDVAVLAQGVASKEKLYSEIIPFDEQFIQRLREAKEKKKIAIIVLDSWALMLEEYEKIMAKYDELSLWNCALVIPWNAHDAETVQQRATLEKVIRKTLATKTRPKDPDTFRDASNSAEEFQRDLAIALSRVRSKIIEIAQDYRSAEGPEPIPQPVVSAVAGGGVR